MYLALSKSKLVRVLLALLLVQTISFASIDGSEDTSTEDTSPHTYPNPSPPSSSQRLSYTMLNVEDKEARDDPTGYVWKKLLEEMEPVIAKRLQVDKKSIYLAFRETGCKEPTPTCDTVSIYKEKDSYGVARYRVYLHCNEKSEEPDRTDNDAINDTDIIDMIAEFIGTHDDRHFYRAQKQNR